MNTNNRLIKSAYVRGLAARGILRARVLQKQAAGEKIRLADTGSPSFWNKEEPSLPGIPSRALTNLGNYSLAGGAGAGIGALIGALVQYARKKNVLKGALIGGGTGALAGLLGRGIYDATRPRHAITGISPTEYVNPSLDIIFNQRGDRGRNLTLPKGMKITEEKPIGFDNATIDTSTNENSYTSQYFPKRKNDMNGPISIDTGSFGLGGAKVVEVPQYNPQTGQVTTRYELVPGEITGNADFALTSRNGYEQTEEVPEGQNTLVYPAPKKSPKVRPLRGGKRPRSKK